MKLERTLTSYFDGLSCTRIGLRSPTVLLPFVAFGLLQAIIVALLASLPNPALAPVLVPVVRALGGEPALHYPEHFVLLPVMFRRVYLPLVATVGFALWTLAVWWMVDRHEVGRRGPAPRFRAHLLDAVLIGIVFTAVSAGPGRLVALLVRLVPAGPASHMATLAGTAVIACAQALLVFAPVVLRIRGVRAPEAIRVGIHYARRVFGPTVLVVLTVLLLNSPVDYLIASAPRIALHFRPETILYLQMLSILLEIVTAYVLFASVVGLALPEEGGLR